MVGSFFTFWMMTMAVFSAPVEQQMKFLYSEDESQIAFDGFKTIHHDTFSVLDLYLDTKERSLYKAGYSLRLRRAIKAGQPVYLLQFKSEMVEESGVRLEYDAPGIENFENGGEIIRQVLTKLSEKSEPCSASLSRIESVINSERWSVLPPLQMAEAKGARQELRVLSVGYSQRERYHIGYVKGEETGVLSYLPENSKAIPNANGFVWLFELSKDRSEFYLTRNNCEQVIVREIEIENKFRPRKWGDLMLTHFVGKSVRPKGWTPHLASKYAQVIAKEKHDGSHRKF